MQQVTSRVPETTGCKAGDKMQELQYPGSAKKILLLTFLLSRNNLKFMQIFITFHPLSVVEFLGSFQRVGFTLVCTAVHHHQVHCSEFTHYSLNFSADNLQTPELSQTGTGQRSRAGPDIINTVGVKGCNILASLKFQT